MELLQANYIAKKMNCSHRSEATCIKTAVIRRLLVATSSLERWIKRGRQSMESYDQSLLTLAAVSTRQHQKAGTQVSYLKSIY